MAAGGVGRDADLASGAEGWSAFESDDVGGRRIVEEVGVELGEGCVGEEDEGEFAGGHGREWRGGFWRAPRRIRRSQGSRGKIGVEGVNDAGDGAAVEAEARVAVGDGDFAGGHFCGRDFVRVMWVRGGKRRPEFEARRTRRPESRTLRGSRVSFCFCFIFIFSLGA